MKNLKGSMRKQTDSKFLHVKRIIEANPKHILDVVEERRIVLVKIGDSFEPYFFEKDIWPEIVGLIKKEIRTRPDPDERVEMWECKNLEGVYDFDIETNLLKSRRRNKTSDKPYVNRRALKQLTDEYDLPTSMGPLFLSELKLSNLPGDESAKNKANLLGLI